MGLNDETDDGYGDEQQPCYRRDEDEEIDDGHSGFRRRGFCLNRYMYRGDRRIGYNDETDNGSGRHQDDAADIPGSG